MRKEKFLVITVLVLASVLLYSFFHQEPKEWLINIKVEYRNTSPFFRTFVSGFAEHFTEWWAARGSSEFGLVEEPLWIGEEPPFIAVYLETGAGPELVWRAYLPFSQSQADVLARQAVSATAGFLKKYFSERYI